VAAGAAPAAALAQLEALLTQAQLALEETVPLLADLVGLPLPAKRYPPRPLPPEQQRQRTLEVLLALVGGLAEQQPVLVIVEDLHWVDPSTRELLRLPDRSGPDHLHLHRGHLSPALQARGAFARISRPLALHRLTPSQAAAMVEADAGHSACPRQFGWQIVARRWHPVICGRGDQSVLEAGRSADARRWTWRPVRGQRWPFLPPSTSLAGRARSVGQRQRVAQLGRRWARVSLFCYLHPCECTPPYAPVHHRPASHGA